MNFWKDAWTVDLILTHAGYIDLILVKNKKLVVWLDIKLDTIRLRNHFVAEFIFFAPFLKMSQHSSPTLNSRWQWCWWHHYVGDFMMVTVFRCWSQNYYVGSQISWIGHQHLKLVINTLVPNIRHQNRCNHVQPVVSLTSLNICFYFNRLKISF